MLKRKITALGLVRLPFIHELCSVYAKWPLMSSSSPYQEAFS